MAIFDSLKKRKSGRPTEKEVVIDTAQQKIQDTRGMIPASANPFLIKRPLITEKAVHMSDLRKYVFLVDGKTSAEEAKKQVQRIYRVKVEKINMSNIVKRRARRRWIPGGAKFTCLRKAIVTLAEGQELDIIPK